MLKILFLVKLQLQSEEKVEKFNTTSVYLLGVVVVVSWGNIPGRSLFLHYLSMLLLDKRWKRTGPSRSILELVPPMLMGP